MDDFPNTPESEAVNRLLTLLENSQRARKVMEEVVTEMQKEQIRSYLKLQSLPKWRRTLITWLSPKT